MSTKQVYDDFPLKAHESYEASVFDDSQYNYDVGDAEDGPSYKADVISRGLDFANHKLVLNQNLDEFMDKQLQNVATKLAEKKSIEKYNMVLRINMKNHMDEIQEMLDDSANIQQRLLKENASLQALTRECDQFEFEIGDTLNRIQELKQLHASNIDSLETDKSKLYASLSESRDQFVVQRQHNEAYVETQKANIEALQQKFK